MASSPETDSGGCGVLLLGFLALALVVGALISLATIVDPFSWMPPVSEVWAQCEEEDECDLHVRFPDFWWHALVNLAYFTVVSLLLAGLWATAAELRRARVARFESAASAQAHVEKRKEFALLLAVTLACGIVPIAVAAARLSPG